MTAIQKEDDMFWMPPDEQVPDRQPMSQGDRIAWNIETQLYDLGVARDEPVRAAAAGVRLLGMVFGGGSR